MGNSFSLNKLSCAALLVVALATPAQLLAQTTYTEVSAAAGVDSVHTSNIDTYMQGGIAAADFDNDGWQDLFVQGGVLSPNDLFMNNGDGTFTSSAAAWGVDEVMGGGGVAVGDYDDDGWLDMFVPCWGVLPALGPGNHRLYHNDGGKGFTDAAAAAGLTTASPSDADGYSAAFGDIDLDGDLDLFVTGWMDESQGNRLFRNEGDSTFTDVTATAIDITLDGVKGFSPQFVDMDHDRWPELLLVADFDTTLYFKNDGDGTFTDMTAAAGVTGYEWGMGSTVADFDGNGWLDWYITSIHKDAPNPGEGNLLYMSYGPHNFVEESQSWTCSNGGWAWGVVAVDVDHDGEVDIVENNGWHRSEEFTDEPMYLFMNQGGSAFANQASESGLDAAIDGRGLLRFDFDNDGDQDMAVYGADEPLSLYRNDLSGPDTHWLRVFLDDGGQPGVAPNGFQSLVKVKFARSLQMRSLDAGGSYLSTSELSAHFGLGSSNVIAQLEVHWADGHVDTLLGVPADQTLTITCCGAWENRDGGLATLGSFDPPELVGVGDLTAGSTIRLLMNNAASSANAFIAVGIVEGNSPFKSGVLVPDITPPGLVTTATTDDNGALDVASLWPAGVPSGVSLTYQIWVQDPAGVVGFTASNAMRSTTP